MARNWDRYGRQSIDVAHAVASVGFSAAKLGTKLGVSSIQIRYVEYVSYTHYLVLSDKGFGILCSRPD